MTKNTLFRILKFSTFSILFFLLYFLLSSQSGTPVYATSHAGCSATVSSVEVGGTISVTHGGFAAGEDFVVFGTLSQKVASQKTQDSQSALVTQNVTVPSDTVPGDGYHVLIRTRFPEEFYTCTVDTFTVTAAPAATSCGVSTDPARPFLPDPVKPGDTFIVSGLGFDPAVGFHSVRLTGYYGDPDHENLALMSYNPSTGAWSAYPTVPATAPGLYVVRVDSTVCYPNLVVEAGLPPLTGECAKADVNGDGTVTVEDANEVLLHFGDPPLGSKYDVNGDGALDLSDATEVLACVGATGGGGVVECSDFLDCVGNVVSPSSQPPETLVGDLVTKILPLAIALGGMVSVIMIVVSGIQFITSSGNPDGAAAARGRLTFSIIGFVLLVLAFVVTRVIDSVFLRGSGIF